VTATLDPRPAMRGVLHRIFVLLGIPAFAVMAVLASTGTSMAAVLVYGAGVTAMLGTSAVYHSGRLSERVTAVLKRIDHVTILFAIAGSYTAVTVLALDGASERTLLVFVWTAAVVGAALRMFWLHAPRPVVAAVYLVVGWSALIEIGAISESLNAIDLTLMVVGGGLYTVGAVVYAAKRPDPWPRHFGFHEIFHLLVVMAATAHYVLVMRLLTGAA